ncbi:zinc transporter ZIP1-like [Drosophila hydei]|uniref:Zinc transporter ZIP1-like n=1 Tax=Drosophila hydei TaxID=7224 RepID=A0A6J2SUX3_DROHY|nr:zinc transporter ZIP1-like [Drosophila hydei]XP_030080946.1 zinc transporter ZIP1-like [Drosophila hydei]
MYEIPIPPAVPSTTANFMEVEVESSTMATVTVDKHALIVAKIVAMVVLIVVTVVCGSLPYMLDRCLEWTKKDPEETRASTAVRCLLYFGGGVLLCTTFLHMLPEVIEVVELLQHCGILVATPFALPEMLMCTGFFLMYALDEVMHVFMQHHQHKLSRKESLASEAFERGHSIRHSILLRSTRRKPDELQASKEEHQHSDHELPAANGHGHSHVPVDTNGSSMRGLGIILALSLHELFEGMAIGLEGTVATVWFMFAAVAAHKLVLAFCVGMELLVARTRASLAIIYLVTFSIVTPIGIGIGIGISQQANANQPSVPSGILQGIASGTLLYVVFFEILTQNHAGWRAYLAALVGFALMFGLQILSDEAEGADNDSCY